MTKCDYSFGNAFDFHKRLWGIKALLGAEWISLDKSAQHLQAVVTM